MKLTSKEIGMLAKVYNTESGEVVTEIERRSDREFDLTVRGQKEYMPGSVCMFSAWLILAAINNLLDWTSPTIAKMTDYPQMARVGDWSGVRDTEGEKLWTIFNEVVVPQV